MGLYFTLCGKNPKEYYVEIEEILFLRLTVYISKLSFHLRNLLHCFLVIMSNSSVQLAILGSVKKSLVRGKTCSLPNMISELLRIFKMLDEHISELLQGQILHEEMKNFFPGLWSLSAVQINENHMHLTESVELYWY